MKSILIIWTYKYIKKKIKNLSKHKFAYVKKTVYHVYSMIHNRHSKVDKHFLFTSINQNICNMYKLMKLLLKYYFTVLKS